MKRVIIELEDSILPDVRALLANDERIVFFKVEDVGAAPPPPPYEEPSDLRSFHAERIIKHMKPNEVYTIKDLMGSTGLSDTFVRAALVYLTGRGRITEWSQNRAYHYRLKSGIE